jgi:hypothetical protein
MYIPTVARIKLHTLSGPRGYYAKKNYVDRRIAVPGIHLRLRLRAGEFCSSHDNRANDFLTLCRHRYAGDSDCHGLAWLHACPARLGCVLRRQRHPMPGFGNSRLSPVDGQRYRGYQADFGCRNVLHQSRLSGYSALRSSPFRKRIVATGVYGECRRQNTPIGRELPPMCVIARDKEAAW